MPDCTCTQQISRYKLLTKFKTKQQLGCGPIIKRTRSCGPVIFMVQSAQEFSVNFANAVTARSMHRYDWVARRGRLSIFNLMHAIAPSVRRARCYKRSDLDSDYVANRCCRHLEEEGTIDSIGVKITYIDSNLFDSESMRRAAFNRFLEQSGFARLRVRIQCIVK
jgi:hypothetical protein